MSEKTKHTPGPWEARKTANGMRIAPVGADEAQADVAAVFIQYIGANTYRGKYDREANAHLIAAAPELLAACEALIEWRNSCDDLPTDTALIGAYQRARRAIAKAHGEAR